MITWVKNLFKPKQAASYREPSENDMRRTPVDNPLDYREDGSIRAGDPAYDMMMEVMRTGNPTISTQRKDGTWETKEMPLDEE